MQPTNVEQLVEGICHNLRGESTAGFPIPAPYERVSEIQIWIDRWHQSEGATRQRIEDACELATIRAVETGDSELTGGTLRLLRQIRSSTIDQRPLPDSIRDALVFLAHEGCFRGVETSYGDLHAELLACIGRLKVKADDPSFWKTQMEDSRYVTNAASGCLDSGSKEVALQGVIHAVKFHDPLLAFSIDRLFKLYHPEEDRIWQRFRSAVKNSLWTKDDWDRMAEAAMAFDRTAPDFIVEQPSIVPNSARGQDSVLESFVLVEQEWGVNFRRELVLRGSSVTVKELEQILQIRSREQEQKELPTRPGSHGVPSLEAITQKSKQKFRSMLKSGELEVHEGGSMKITDHFNKDTA